MDQRILQIIQKHPELKSEFEEIYPELKESEDEKIRNFLVGYFGVLIDENSEWGLTRETRDRILAYLEKLKEPRHAIRVTKGFGNPDGPQFELVDLQKEQKPFSQEVFDAAKHEALWGEQKPAEWSEEDEMNLYNIIEAIKYTYDVSDGSGGSRLITWLKSLRPLPQQNMLIGFMLYLDEHRPDGKMCLSNAECNQLEIAFRNQDWSTILKYAEKYLPHWKPSEEHSQGLPKVTISRGKF